MSKFCGIWYFDSRPVTPAEAQPVTAVLAAPGYSSPRVLCDPGLVLGWAAGADAPAKRGWFQTADRSICLWDGRLDNRRDLLSQTGLPADSSECALALALYRQKGRDGLRDLVGDWSLAIWDASARELILASDYAGIRPLYYQRGSQALYWSTSLADLVRWTGASELDERYMAHFLMRGSSPHGTPFAGISPVAPGHAVRITRENAASQRFWDLPFHADIRYRDDRQYQERVRELFQDAVGARIGAGTGVCCELSGGLDSSSIVCMADRLRRRMSAPPQITSFSFKDEDSRDETYFREVERATGIPFRHYDLRQCRSASADQAAIVPTFWEPRFRLWSADMAAMGAGVLLTGQSGDLIMGNSLDDTSQVTESLARFRFGQAAGEAYAWARAMQAPIYPILWRSMREAFLRWSPTVDPRSAVGAIPTSTEDSLSPRLRSRLQEQPPDGGWEQVSPGRRTRFRAVGEMLESRRFQTPEALQHLSYGHPYVHRPLVEFMLSIPPRVVFGPNQPRRLMRSAFAGLLPPLILNRKTKGEYGSAYRSDFLPLAASLLRQPDGIELVARGYLDCRSLISRLERFTQGLDCNENQLRSVLLVEYWLKNRAPLVVKAEKLAGVSSSTE